MLRSLRVIALYLGVGFLLAFFLFAVNQVLQVYDAVSAINPVAGLAVASTLAGAFLGLFGIPVVMYYQLPEAPSHPENKHSKEFEEHLEALKSRLARNELVEQNTLSTQEDIERAIDELDSEAEEHIHNTALSLFVSTAVSQSGRLDGLMVLASQVRMIWKIAHIYYQRPAVRDLVWLYSNVAAATFMAAEIDDVDLSDELEPFLEQAIGSVSSAIPVIGSATSFLVESVLSGTANSFFTLRVGVIAKEYCGMLTRKNARQVRNTATAQATSMIGSVVNEGTAKLSDVAKDVASEKSEKAIQWGMQKAEEKRQTAKSYYSRKKENAKDAWAVVQEQVGSHRRKLLTKVGLASTEDKLKSKMEDESN